MKSLLSLIAFLVSTSASAYTLDGMSVWQSDYIVGKGSFTVRADQVYRCGNGQQGVTVSHNPNECSLDELGLPNACTLIGPSQEHGILKYVAVAATRDTSVYQVSGTNYRLVTALTANSAPHLAAVRLLILNDRGEVVDAVSLKRNFAAEPVIEPIRRGVPSTCAHPAQN
jgi:hypothetical protein